MKLPDLHIRDLAERTSERSLKIPLSLSMSPRMRNVIYLTRIWGCYAPLILAPADGFSLEPCTKDQLFRYFTFKLSFIKGLIIRDGFKKNLIGIFQLCCVGVSLEGSFSNLKKMLL